MKWFNLSAIFKEISKIRWPKKSDLAANSLKVIVFVGLFSIFFFLCALAISALFKVMGVL